MNLRKTLSLALCVLPLFAFGQTFEEYVKLRKKHGIARASNVEEIEDFVGKRILEVQGTVKGIIGSGESQLLLVEGPSRVQHYVRSANTPDWLKNGQVPVRIIIEGVRSAQGTMLEATMLGVAGEQEVANYEAKSVPVRTISKSPLRGPINTSRKGGRPMPMQGNIPKTTTNPIGNVKEGIGEELASALPAYIDFIKGRNPKLDDSQAQRIAESILAYSAHFGVDARLIVAIIITESDFNPNTQSNKGAMGLGQLMPFNVKALGLKDGFNIEENLWGTVRMVRGNIDRYTKQTSDSFEALVLALAGYNAGNGAVKKYGGVPPYRETQNYVRKVVGYYQQLCGK